MIEGYGAPDINTPGNVGSFYRDLETNTLYKCTGMISEPVQKQFVSVRSHIPTTQYEWEEEGKVEVEQGGGTIEFLKFSNEDISARTKKPKAELYKVDGVAATGFAYCTYLVSATNLKTDDSTVYNGMFTGCSQLTTVSGIDNIDSDFAWCRESWQGTLDEDDDEVIVHEQSECPPLNAESWAIVLNALSPGDTMRTAKLGTNGYNAVANLYCRITDPANAKLPMELCNSGDAGAISAVSYAAMKNWTISSEYEIGTDDR